MKFRVENPAQATLALLAEYGLCMDAGYRGEIARLFDSKGYKRLYYRKGGLTLDGFGEVLVDAGVVSERPQPDEILQYLDDLFRRTKRAAGRKRASTNSLEADERHARVTRLRLYVCDTCGQKLRGTRQTDVICNRCVASVFATIAAEIATELQLGQNVTNAIMSTVRDMIQPMRRVDPLPEEILAQSWATMEGVA